MGIMGVPGSQTKDGVEPPAKTCTCLFIIHHGAAPISNFAFCRITSVTC